MQNIVQSTRKTFGVPSQGVLIESSDKIVRLSEARYACETRLWELEQQFEVKTAKVREEYLAAVLEIHASEANGNQMLTTRDLIRIRYIVWKVRARCWLVERLMARAGRLARPE